MLSAGWTSLWRMENWWLYGLYAFFSTLCVYNLQRLFKITRYKRTPWLLWVHRYRVYIYVLVAGSFAGAALCLLSLLKFQWAALLCIVLAGLISVFYVVKVKGKINLRDIPYLKIHLIAFTWVLVLILFPLMNEHATSHGYSYAIAHYAYVLAITIPFDIRDLKYDEAEKKTIPQVLGVQGAKILSVVLLAMFLATMVVFIPDLRDNYLIYSAVLVQLLLVFAMNPQRSDLYCAGGIDGAIGLLGLAYYLG